ncbi:MAG: DUF3332 domain-containing protein [Muribaculaceae bacterium]|nr:DUF3332 domain-containing protein [Muribaculaceae bacterium]
MKRYKLAVGAILLAGVSLTFTSCIGSFTLTKRVLEWNNQVSNKFVNELVFFAFWFLPVYEVTALADIFVLNSIEFWSGNNPMQASTKVIDTEHGRYIIKSDKNGYDIISQATGEKTRLNYASKTQTWSIVQNNGEELPFMTFIDANHVKMITPSGDFNTYELSNQGVYAYQADCKIPMMAAK